MPSGSVSATRWVHSAQLHWPSPELPAATRSFAPNLFSKDGLSFWFQEVGANYFAKHRHPQAQIAVGYGVRNGEFEWKVAGAQPVERQAGGDLIWFLPGNTHHTLRLRHAAFWIVFYCDLKLDVVRNVAVRATLMPLGDYVRRDGLIGDLGVALRREGKDGQIENRGHVMNLGALLNSCLLRAHGRETVKGYSVLVLPKELMERVRRFIIDHLREPLTLAILARAAGLGPDYFSRRLKFSTGLTAEQFVLQERLNHAQAMLRVGKHTIEDVSERCGFRSHATMTKRFTLRFGRPPRSYLPGSAGYAQENDGYGQGQRGASLVC